MQRLRDYHDQSLLSDILLLADVFENFRNTITKEHNLDCLHFVTLPSLAWTLALKFTGVELDLITDPNAYLMTGQHAQWHCGDISPPCSGQ